ncbi:hypothetical protein Y032_0001g45 [Ancylostoma ceylanicum]|uniref:Uncharacterized protein n=1 Tax=Ancylostoma ceylanicum TaxID=53326 RepID=A0A016W5G0_9BILA|nr:hypothetical protein Y032_0001g45 [Ancylostoma ceylanicum]
MDTISASKAASNAKNKRKRDPRLCSASELVYPVCAFQHEQVRIPSRTYLRVQIAQGKTHAGSHVHFRKRSNRPKWKSLTKSPGY